MGSASKRRSDSVPKLRVFVASWSELAAEHRRVVDVLRKLSFDDPTLSGRVCLEPVRWDHPGEAKSVRPTSNARQGVVERIGKPSTCQIVVGLLWSKLGQPIEHSSYRKAGDGYFTGTEWALDDATQAWERSGRQSPHIYLFRCTREPIAKRERGETNFSQAGKRLDAQLAEVAHYLDSLAARYGLHPNEFENPAQLEEILCSELRTRVSALLDSGVGATSDAEANEAEAAVQPLTWKGSPYRGLETFEAVHAPVFFGRAGETAQLVERLADSSVRFLLVAGASGTGKSSLVKAGLLPALERDALPNSRSWRTFRFTPAAVSGTQSHHDPFVALANALQAPLGFAGAVERLADRCRQEEGFLRKQLRDTLKDLPEDAECLLFIDQFEELFTHVEKVQRIEFAHCLASITVLPRLRIVATMRSEFLDPFTREQTLNKLTTGDGAIYTISTPTQSALYDMITQPARMAGLVVSPDLAMKILDDAGAVAGGAGFAPIQEESLSEPAKADVRSKARVAPIALPLVEFTLQRLYDQYHNAGKLTVAMYEEIGGISGAIEKCLEDTMSLPAKADRTNADHRSVTQAWEQRLADLFKHLVDVNEAEVATRRRARIEDVKRSPQAWKIATDLQKARLLVTREETIEVAHAALFSAWAPLARWIEQRKVALREWRNMAFAAAEWERKGRPVYLQWPMERQRSFEADTAGLGRSLNATQQVFLKSEVERLLDELDNPAISHERRADIGNRLSFLGDPRPGLGALKDGTPDVSRKGYWCPVTEGTVTLEDKAGTFDVEAGFIAKYPVTRSQFRAFQVAEDGYRNKAWWDDLIQMELALQPQEGYNRPATNVNWWDAIAFCRWLSNRLGLVVTLPTEWQWQQAATRGMPKQAYPWGRVWDEHRANTRESSLNRTTAVGMYPGGAAANDALDLTGNVWEWCLNKYTNTREATIDKSDDNRALRGGSWGRIRGRARCACRYYGGPHGRGGDQGFRLWCSSPILKDESLIGA